MATIDNPHSPQHLVVSRETARILRAGRQYNVRSGMIAFEHIFIPDAVLRSQYKRVATGGNRRFVLDTSISHSSGSYYPAYFDSPHCLQYCGFSEQASINILAIYHDHRATQRQNKRACLRPISQYAKIYIKCIKNRGAPSDLSPSLEVICRRLGMSDKTIDIATKELAAEATYRSSELRESVAEYFIDHFLKKWRFLRSIDGKLNAISKAMKKMERKEKVNNNVSLSDNVEGQIDETDSGYEADRSCDQSLDGQD